jgi:hypothetical protein
MTNPPTSDEEQLANPDLLPGEHMEWPAPGEVSSRPVMKWGTTEVLPGLEIFNVYEAKATQYHGVPFVHVIVKLGGNRRLGVHRLHVYGTDGEPVTSAALRKLPLRAFIQHAFNPVDGAGKSVRSYGTVRRSEAARLREAGPVTETLEAVTRVYQAAWTVGDPPTVAVVETFGIPRPTADGWIRRARERGFLPEKV